MWRRMEYRVWWCGGVVEGIVWWHGTGRGGCGGGWVGCGAAVENGVGCGGVVERVVCVVKGVVGVVQNVV